MKGRSPIAEILVCQHCNIDKPKSEVCILRNGNLTEDHPFNNMTQVCMQCRDMMFVPADNTYLAMCAMTGRTPEPTPDNRPRPLHRSRRDH